MPRHDASAELLDAAERLFSTEGIHRVSDRKVAEAAGNSNHSAVRYYFGGREGLLAALVERHHTALAPHRRELFAASDSLLGDIRALVVPTVRVLAEQPVPGWRARFLAHAYHDPVVSDLLRTPDGEPSGAHEVYTSLLTRIPHLDEKVVRDRAALMGHMVSTTCAVIEARVAEGHDVADWERAGQFLVDAIAGMLQGPVHDPA